MQLLYIYIYLYSISVEINSSDTDTDITELRDMPSVKQRQMSRETLYSISKHTSTDWL